MSRPLADRRVGAAALGFGGAPLGNLFARLDDDVARACVDAAWDAGIRYFDTAPHYGLGLSERRLGAALAGRRREEFVVSTKVGRLLVPNDHRVGSDLAAHGFDVPDVLARRRDYTRDGVRRSLEESLERLGLDRVDVVLVHDAEDHLAEALDTAIPALVELRDQGVVGAIGAGMNYVEPLRRLVAESDIDVVMVAGRWTLLDRSAAELIEECSQHDVIVLAAGPYNSGLLAVDSPTEDATFDYARVPADLLAKARRLGKMCSEGGSRIQSAALQFPLRSPAVTRVVAGFRNPGEVNSAVEWAEAPLSPGLWRELDTASSATVDAAG